jgi:hypothetical protein
VPKDPNALVLLYSAANEFDAAAIAEALTADGVPATHYGLAATTLGPYANTTNPFPVMVRRADFQRAADALKRIRQESVDLDWSEVHGDSAADPPTEIRCATCGYPLTGLATTDPCPECAGTDRREVRLPGFTTKNPLAGPFWTPLRKAIFVVALLLILLLVRGYLANAFSALRALLSGHP